VHADRTNVTIAIDFHRMLADTINTNGVTLLSR